MVDSCFEPPGPHKVEVLQSRDEEIIVLLGKRILQSEKEEGRYLFTDQRHDRILCLQLQERNLVPPHLKPYR